MEPGKFNNHNNLEDFTNLQKQIIESYNVGENVGKPVLELGRLFHFFNEHFEELHQKETFPVMLAFVHRCLKVWISRGDYLEDDIGILLVNLLAEHRESESDINVVVQIIYQVMHSMKYFACNDVLISEKLLCEIIATMPIIESRTLASNCTACIQKYVEMFPQNRKNLKPLWSYIKHQLEINLNNGLLKDIEIDILIQLIDDFKSVQSNFHDEPILISTIQHLLNSDQKQIRKCGYYLLKKRFDYAMDNINTVAEIRMSDDNIQHIERSWILYITMLENLEEEQSHLILPSLENLEELIIKKHLPSPWLNILYVRILTHNNNLVLRWSIEFFLKTFSCSDLSAEILKHLLKATNSNLLFNYEGYFLKKEYVSSFLKGDATCLLTLFSEIENWKSVPLYIWLESFKEKQLPSSLKFEDILQISSCVRKLQNCVIRKNAIQVCEELFEDFKQKMSMKDYVMYIETLYNSSDKYLQHAVFFSKKSSLIQSKPVGYIFKQRFYEIFTNTAWDNNELLSFLNDVPVEQHGWLKFAPFKLKIAERDRSYINNLYKLDLNSLVSCDIDNFIYHFNNSLLGSPPYDKYELMECNQAAISFYIYQKVDFEIDTSRFILNTGINNNEVVATFAEKLLDKIEQKIDLWFIDELLKYKSKRILESVSRYLRRVYDENVIRKYAISISKTYNFISDLFGKIDLLKLITDEWFKELASQGNKRIEDAFCFNHFKPKNFILESSFLMEIIIMYHNEQFALDLLKYHTDITKKKSRYYENSNEHRVKLRIASCIYYSIVWDTKTDINILDQIWKIVLNENNQLNILYIYEFILGKKEFRGNVILCKLKEAQNLTSSQQVSVISVAYIYFQTNPTTREMRNTMVYSLLSLTMGAHFQTRLFAQMSLYQLLKNNFEQTEEWKQLIQSIEDANGTKFPEYLNDIRLHISVLSNKIDAVRIIFYVTSVPFDELLYLSTNVNYWNLLDLSVHSELKCELDQIESYRKRYLNKFTVAKNEETVPKSSTMNYQIQRKINPVNDLTEPHNLIVYPIEEKSAEMFVVASLIDKLPNLGGIARTCEVLGIKNLVMDSKMHTEKNNFKSLSMTAEKSLNVLEVKPKDLKEFLIKKKLEGYNIVGAEQTCNSENFNNFQFPKKCVLLLGHEKDGIPAPLLGLLDNAVEIPQFGQVRSLNVHVTGALFMWEYCKQHLIQK